MKKRVLLLSALLSMSTCVYAADQTTAPQLSSTIAVVNVQQLFQQSSKIADINKKMQGQFKSRQEKLMSDQQSLQNEVDKFKKESPTMSAKDKDALQKKIATDQASFSKSAAAFQDDLNKEQNKVMKDVLAKLNTIVSAIAKKNHYSVVLDSQAVIYSADEVDITKQVAKDFNG